MHDAEYDERLRASAFAFLRARELVTGGPVRHQDVAEFVFEGERIPLLDRQRGIRKPRSLSAALSIRTVHAPRPDLRPYDDAPGPDGYLRYKWRGDDGTHFENVALRRACDLRLPLIWFQGIEPGVYLPIHPVWLVAEEPELKQFVVALDLDQAERWNTDVHVDLGGRRRYAERTVRERLHQPLFRERVLAAYQRRCAICRLQHHQLLDAAHIREDSAGGEPIVTNGISMCKIHHAAYDANLLGVDTEFVVHLRSDILEETDGPTLRHAFQELHQSRLTLPGRRAAYPDRDLLAERYDQFAHAS